MRRFISGLIAICGLTLVPAWAQTAPPQKVLTEVYGTLNATQNKTGTVGNVSGEVEFPLGHFFAFGPTASYSTVRPRGGERIDQTSVGLIGVLNFTNDHVGPYVAVSAETLTSDFHGYTVSPEAGLKFGNDKVAVKVGAAHPFHYNQGESPVDLEGTVAKIGVGIRF